ncbi:MAG: hypothetical protein Q7R49_01670 [Candidatus Daviesbacteria bacterium]|nr:hypothetical protein [Candidatus Daviesbacteria bacterium]
MGIYLSDTDNQPQDYQLFQEGEVLNNPAGKRHRTGRVDYWTIYAEIWAHNDKNNPSDEDDIRRISDDYNRN